jgi:hypothetical protein
MENSTFGLIELILVFGTVFGFGLYELYLLRRDKKPDSAKRGSVPPGDQNA